MTKKLEVSGILNGEEKRLRIEIVRPITYPEGFAGSEDPQKRSAEFARNLASALLPEMTRRDLRTLIGVLSQELRGALPLWIKQLQPLKTSFARKFSWLIMTYRTRSQRQEA